ncbi:plastid division protein PDV1-like isoform X1 [Zingiber officinale]|uniref:plastid division protein PDV1-like isoform X1 n=1 Tax=Zingiber officinale TaxID=94328 RepID=UPI001C4B51BC|nr:plastid division protein PDV1-like isoform X1 [Zingiber officinale]
MKWEMEMEEVEAVLERIWDLHDKISDAIHANSRAHFLRSVKGCRGGRDLPPLVASAVDGGGDGVGKGGFVYVKDFRVDGEEEGSGIAEARSLNAIRSALENLEDELEFFHIVQSQQRAERDAAITRLEQSRVILAMRLADHRGKRYKVIEDALAFVGDVHDMGQFLRPESQLGENLEGREKKPSMFMQAFLSSFAAAERSIRLVGFQGILANAAIFAVSMLAFLQLNQVACNGGNTQTRDPTSYRKRNERKCLLLDKSSTGSQSKHLDVTFARG